MPDYIPAPHAELDAWQRNFVFNDNANLAGLGLVAGSAGLGLTVGQI